MLQSLIFLLALQKCPDTYAAVSGQLLFPAYTAAPLLIEVALEPLTEVVNDRPPRTATTGIDNQFLFFNVPSGTYNVLVNTPGIEPVRQMVILSGNGCRFGARIFVPLHLSPAIKPSPIAEDAVSI